MIDPKNLTIVYAPGMSDAALYDGNDLLYAAHTEDVHEKVLEIIGVAVEYDRDFITDKTARGFAGAAKTLDEIP